jgi:Asp-tRNA(Asn)/Glu-tRNA(Gln) amidotransferase A subunit family amidase
MDLDPTEITACDARLAMAEGRLSVEAYARACLDRVAAREPSVQAWSFIDPERVIAQARALDDAGPSGPLHGLPIGVKDVIMTWDMPTQYNSPIYEGYAPAVDAACVQTLRAAGALIFGKTQTVEFASTGRPAPTRNPSNLAHTPGGSSSGSAAAVADRHVPLALGTQTGGSMIRPASFCGVWAIKPTWNIVSTEGAKRFSTTLDTIGWFGRSAQDLRLLYDVLDPEPATDADIFELSGARIAFCRTPVWDSADPATRAAMSAAEERLRAAGARVELLELPAPFDRLNALQDIVMRGEGGSAFLSDYRTDAARLHPSIRDQVENAHGYSRAMLCEAYDIAAQCRVAFDALAGAFDAVVTPSTVGTAPEGLTQTGALTFNAMWTLLHTPCVNVPGFTGKSGMPVGVTVTAPRFADRKVMAAAEACGTVFGG